VTQPTTRDICAVACAEQFRGDGEIVASAFSVLGAIAVRLAKASFEPLLVTTDGEALLVGGLEALDSTEGVVVEGYCPYAAMLDLAFSGRRHAIMGANQLDRYGNQNISNIGPWAKPRVQLAGFRGVPVNTINHAVSYWVPRHTPKVFVERVDVVTGVGYDRAAQLGAPGRFHSIRGVVTGLGVFDFETADRRMRVRSLHPGVSLDDAQKATGFELAVTESVTTTRRPTDDELALLDRIDPTRRRDAEL
jgi:acyl CoA:acetate/3-ketoacid CoA transferase beta subunit